ncbi:autophagy-related protein 13a [Oryza glaberrima]|uniref:Autophagy-related protein 13 N-terminal domain-containing protein n=1 Tax=Oryza glaberrima TaxID=4538 RepID=I1P2K2_ORYGL|nr:autophagy-related protein 13a [Oryza glaberrima]
MATLSDSAGGGGGGRAGAELMVPQFHLKALHAILAVRAPRPLAAAPAPAASFRRRDRWFHLPLHAPPPPASAEHLPEPPPGEPLVVDVYLTPSGGGGGAEAVVERWTVSCEPWSAGARGGGAAAASGEGLAVNRAYKRCITLLRSVYTALRLLPAYRVFRLLCASGQAYNYEMGFRVGSFAAPFTRAEEAAMSTRRFAPVETQLGRLVVSVQYLPSLAAFNLEICSLAPAMLITDYVGSPAADPMRAFPASLTEAASSAPAFPPRRPNSWAPSPAPWPYTPGQQAKFSPPPALYASPTPSPPTFAGGYLQSRLSGETAPMIIPGGGRGPVHNRNMSDPVRGFMLPPPSPKNIRGDSGGHETPMETGRTGIRMADLYTNLPSVPKIKIKDSRDESGRFSGVFSSSGSPRLGFSRSSSRLSMQDDTDDLDFPFAVDDVDTPDSRPGSSGGKDVGDQASSSSHKSQDAAVGYLVHMLKSARPLRDSSNSPLTSRVESEGGNVSSFMSRRTSDALEELESFKEIKENLLARSRSRMQESLDKSLRHS